MYLYEIAERTKAMLSDSQLQSTVAKLQENSMEIELSRSLFESSIQKEYSIFRDGLQQMNKVSLSKEDDRRASTVSQSTRSLHLAEVLVF